MHLLLPASITRACHVADAMLGVRGTIAEQGPILAQPLPKLHLQAQVLKCKVLWRYPTYLMKTVFFFFPSLSFYNKLFLKITFTGPCWKEKAIRRYWSGWRTLKTCHKVNIRDCICDVKMLPIWAAHSTEGGGFNLFRRGFRKTNYLLHR